MRRPVHCLLIALATTVTLTDGRPAAQSRRAMTPVDLIEVPRIQDPQLSPDDRQLLYVLDRPDWKENRRVGHIWRVNVDGSAAMQLTFGQRGESSPRWSPDGKRIAFLARREDIDDAQLYVLENDGGEARRVMKHPAAVSNIQWAPDSHSIFFLAPDAKSQDEKDREKIKDDVYAFEENYKQRHLWSVKIDSGSSAKITQGDYSIGSYALSDDGRKVVLHRAISPVLEHGRTSEVWVMNADGSGALQVTRNNVAETGGRLSPDNTQDNALI